MLEEFAASHWFDAHCHLSDPSLYSSFAAIVAAGSAAGIDGYLLAGYDPADWRRQIELVQKHPGIYSAFGIHPWALADMTDDELAVWLAELATLLPAAKAIGEIGLDFYRAKLKADRKKQELVFLQQLAFAAAQKKPVILHVVKAHEEVLRCLRTLSHGSLCGFVHGFSGSIELARRYLDIGFYLSFGPAILGFANSDLLRYIPDNRLLIESDAPNHQRRAAAYGHPEVIISVAKCLAAIRCEPEKDLLQITANNARRLLALPVI